MTDEINKSQPTDLQTTDSKDVYRIALDRVFAELEQLKLRKKELSIRESQLNETVKALMPLTGDYIPDINEFSLSNAVRFVFNGLAIGNSLSAIEVRAKLNDLGYNLAALENPLANIHSAMRRMFESEELIKTEDDKKKFEPGPELKSVTESIQKQLDESLGK